MIAFATVENTEMDGYLRASPQDPMQGYLAAGKAGTQSGPAEESTTMQIERAIQMLSGYGLAIPAAILGGTIAGTPGAIAGGTAAGLPLVANAQKPNIRDVWFDQFRTAGHGRRR